MTFCRTTMMVLTNQWDSGLVLLTTITGGTGSHTKTISLGRGKYSYFGHIWKSSIYYLGRSQRITIDFNFNVLDWQASTLATTFVRVEFRHFQALELDARQLTHSGHWNDWNLSEAHRWGFFSTVHHPFQPHPSCWKKPDKCFFYAAQWCVKRQSCRMTRCIRSYNFDRTQNTMNNRSTHTLY